MEKLGWLPAAIACLGLYGCITDKESKAPGPFTEMYMVGNAAPSGWNIEHPDTLTRDPANPYLWHWHGPLYSGELKFPTYAGTWSADYFMPLSPVQKDLSLTTTHLVINGSPDYKWMVTDSTSGEYDILLDTRTPAVHFNRIGPIPQ